MNCCSAKLLAMPGQSLLLGRNPFTPRDIADPFHAAHRLDDLLEVLEVLDFDHDRADGAAVHGFEVHLANVRAGGADGARDIGVQATAIGTLEREAHDEALAEFFLQSISRRRSGSCASGNRFGQSAR